MCLMCNEFPNFKFNSHLPRPSVYCSAHHTLPLCVECGVNGGTRKLCDSRFFDTPDTEVKDISLLETIVQ